VKILPCTKTRANYTEKRLAVIILECRNCPYYDGGLGGQWCDKVGGYNYRFGHCSDIYHKEIEHKNHSKHKRRNKIERDQKHKNHLKFLAENIQYYPCPVIYTDEIWIEGQGYVENPKPYYKRLYRGRGRRSNSNYHKKMSNRKIRRYTGELPKKGNFSHKLYDFWWELC